LDPARREALLRHARRHFASNGYEAASVSKINQAADFPRSSFYYFFGEKDALFEAAFSDGLEKLSGRVAVPHPSTLDADSFWPTVFGLIDSISEAQHDEDLACIPVLFHLPDAPPSPSLDKFRDAAREWCGAVVRVGRGLGLLDQEIPDDLHQDLVWNIASTVDGWVARNHENAHRAEALTRKLVVRVLGGQ